MHRAGLEGLKESKDRFIGSQVVACRVPRGSRGRPLGLQQVMGWAYRAPGAKGLQGTRGSRRGPTGYQWSRGRPTYRVLASQAVGLQGTRGSTCTPKL